MTKPEIRMTNKAAYSRQRTEVRKQKTDYQRIRLLEYQIRRQMTDDEQQLKANGVRSR